MSRLIRDNVDYVINVFKLYGIELDEDRNFYMCNGDYGITVNRNGGEYTVEFNDCKNVYEVKHLNTRGASKGKNHMHVEMSSPSLIPIAKYLSVVHIEYVKRREFQRIKGK